jgi:hypothetical protein
VNRRLREAATALVAMFLGQFIGKFGSKKNVNKKSSDKKNSNKNCIFAVHKKHLT